LLVESESKNAASQLRSLLSHENATTRLRALWTLKGLDTISESDVIEALEDENIHLLVSGTRLAAELIGSNPKLLDAVIRLSNHPIPRVRFQVALSLGENDSPAATQALCELALRDGHDSWFADGLMTSAKSRSGAILASLVASDSFAASGDEHKMRLLKKLAAIVGARGDIGELNQLFEIFQSQDGGSQGAGDWWKAATISGLGQGLPRHRGELGRMSLAKMIANPPAKLAGSIQNLKQVFEKSEQIAKSGDASVADRAAAVELLGYRTFAKAGPAFEQLLSNDQPVEVQSACIDALARNGSTDAAQIVLDRWPELGPTVRGAALELLLRRVESTRMTLEAMAAGTMNKSALSIDQRVRLLKHKDADLKKRASKLFGGAVSSNRQKVAKDYEPCLSLQANASSGVRVFRRICAACHKLDGIGHDAGPDLSDVRNRSKPAILYDILDPNSKVEPRFTAYSVLTLDGVVFNGLIVSETSEAVVLKMAEGKQQTIGRAEIDQIKVSDVSLMPEGVEKDLLEYLKSRG
jgi:putative heme-binding domain-containing protein